MKSYNADLDKTKDIRRSETKLFFSVLKPHRPVGVKTISRWIKESLKTAGVNVEHYQGHSLRSASASAGKSNTANISDLSLAGGWSNERAFAKFYNKPYQDIYTFVVMLNLCFYFP